MQGGRLRQGIYSEEWPGAAYDAGASKGKGGPVVVPLLRPHVHYEE